MISEKAAKIVRGKTRHTEYARAKWIGWARRQGWDYPNVPDVPDHLREPDPATGKGKPLPLVLSLTCQHRGEEVRQVECKACPRETVLKPVYACALHGECTLTRVNQDIKGCNKCPDRQPPQYPGEWAVGITTAPRKKPTLLQCLESLMDNGWTPIVYAEPSSPLGGVNCEVVKRREKLGAYHNWLNMLADLLDRHPQAKWVLTVQDDTVFCDRTKEFVEQVHLPDLPPNLGMLSLYTSKKYTMRRSLKPGRFRIPLVGFWGALGCVFPRAVAESILTLPLARDWRSNKESDPTRRKNVDTFIGNAMKRLGKEIWCFEPSLSQHVATHSTISHGGNKGRRNAERVATDPFRDCVLSDGKPRFAWKTYADLTADVQAWCRALPEISAVCGVPRSGMIPAAIIAQERHIPLVPLEALLGNMPHYRAEWSRELRELAGPVLIVDDSCSRGKTMQELRRVLTGDRYLFGAVYARPQSRELLDLFHEDTGTTDRTFEWLFLRDRLTEQTLTDLDGVLCADWDLSHEKYTAQYQRHLQHANPQRIPAYPLLGIVTGRWERYRQQTEDWLNRHGIRYGTLWMAPDGTRHDRHAEFKAGIYSAQQSARFFLESAEWQAAEIAEITGKPVLSLETLTLHGER